MVKTSYRIPDETQQALAALADQCHNGNRTAALVEAIRRYQEAIFTEPVQAVGWVQIRVNAKTRCAKCHNPIDGPGFVQLGSDGRIDPKPHCGKCAK